MEEEQTPAQVLFEIVNQRTMDEIQEDGFLTPMGLAMATDGTIKIAMSGVDNGNESRDLLIEGFRSDAQSGEIVAAAICLDVLLPAKQGQKYRDAIMIILEDNIGHVMHCIRPYRKEPTGYIFGEIVGLAASPLIFQNGET